MSRHSSDPESICPLSNDVVWVNKRYTPNELRSTAPVPRFKFLNPTKLPSVADSWKKPGNY